MQNWIAGLLAVLGTLLVLTGGTVTALQTLGPAPAPDQTPHGGSLLTRLRRLNGADRLLLWGVVLLVIATIAAGAISFTLSASAGTR